MNLFEIIDKIECDLNIAIPNKEDIFTGGDEKNFLLEGCNIVRALIRDAGLTPYHHVLEIGSGIGRPAIPLARILSHGSYYGIEIVKHAVDWCKANITADFPNFQFVHLDIYNEFYNPNGKLTMQDVRLPFALESFDIIFLSSVFTHQTREDFCIYLNLIARLLKKSGKCWATIFMVDKGVGTNILDGRAKISITTEIDGMFYSNSNKGTLAVALREEMIDQMFSNANLSVIYKQRGNWCEREKIDGGFQDVIVAKLYG